MTQALLAAGIGAFAGAVLLTPLAGRLARRHGLIDHPKPGRAHQAPTPFLGGLAILAGILLGAAIALPLLPPNVRLQLGVILAGAVLVSAVGLRDDVSPVPPRLRVAVELAAGAAVAAAGVRLRVTPWEPVNVAVTLLWVVGITNAVNLLDNMDGLASGAVAIAAAGTAYLAAEGGQRIVAAMALALTGACLGFLVHNRPPARIFMGDMGSLVLGFFLAVTVAKLDLLGSPGPVRVAVVMLLCGVGVLDTALVVVSRLQRHRSPFAGGTDHSSHRLLRAGISQGRALLALHALSGWFVASAILLHHLRSGLAVAVVVVSGLLAALALRAFLRLPADGSLPRLRKGEPAGTPPPR